MSRKLGSGGWLRWYVNGQLDASTTPIFSSVTASNLSVFFAGRGRLADYFNGRLDETRIQATARTTDWTIAEYRNQNSPATFYTVGGEQTPLFISDTPHVHSADEVSLTEHKTLSVDQVNHSHEAASTSISQVHNLIINGSSHNQMAAGLLDLLEEITLAPENGLHLHTADETIAVPGGNPVPYDSDQSHLVDNVELQQLHILTVEDVIQGHLASIVPITQAHLIIAEQSFIAHSSEHRTLVQHHLLGVPAALHGHLATNPTLFQRHVLEALSALHEHSAEDPYVFTQLDLLVQGALHGLSSEVIEILIKTKLMPRPVIVRIEKPRIQHQKNDPRFEGVSRNSKARIVPQVKSDPIITDQRSKPRLRNF